MATTLDTTRVTVPDILKRKHSASKITALTAYDYTFAHLLDSTGIDIILVGDSLGAVVQGRETTLPVTLDEMIYHCACVSRAAKRALVVGDMPFLSYQVSAERAVESAGRMLKEGGVAAVKLEGGVKIKDTVSRLIDVDIPVMGHVGLTPQSYHRMGGHRVQGREREAEGAGSAERILDDALALENAGVFSLVIEGVPEELAGEITRQVSVPTIGIGAGRHCDGQILVTHDMLGFYPDAKPKFVKMYAEFSGIFRAAVGRYRAEVEGGTFPSEEHTFHSQPSDGKKNPGLKLV